MQQEEGGGGGWWKWYIGLMIMLKSRSNSTIVLCIFPLVYYEDVIIDCFYLGLNVPGSREEMSRLTSS
jgi:hypothetical protein